MAVLADSGDAARPRLMPASTSALQILAAVVLVSAFVLWEAWPGRAALDARPLPAILYEPGPGGQVTRIPATVSWSIVDDPQNGAGVVARLTVPERSVSVQMSFRRNADASLPASHLVEIVSDAGPSPAGRVIANVEALMVPTTRAPKALAGLSTKIADGAFWLALSPEPRDVAANLRLLRYAPFIDIPLTYASGQRGALEFPKGAIGSAFFRAEMLAETPQ